MKSQLLQNRHYHSLTWLGASGRFSDRVIWCSRMHRNPIPTAKTVIDFPKTGRHNPSQTLEVVKPLFCFLFSRRVGATS
jgi:hypothetical protein